MTLPNWEDLKKLSIKELWDVINSLETTDDEDGDLVAGNIVVDILNPKVILEVNNIAQKIANILTTEEKELLDYYLYYSGQRLTENTFLNKILTTKLEIE